MYLELSGVIWPLAKTHLHVIMGNLHFKKSRSQGTAVDPKLFFKMLDIYSCNIIFEGYWKISSGCEDIDRWSSRVNCQSSHFEKSPFRQGSDDPWQPEVHLSGMCYILFCSQVSYAVQREEGSEIPLPACAHGPTPQKREPKYDRVIHLVVSDSHVQWLYEARANTLIKIFQIFFYWKAMI